MTTSGTTTFDLDLVDIVEEAYERAGSEMRSGYDLRTARRSLNLMFIDWANRGLNMWTFEEASVDLVDGTATYTLPTDTVDVLDAVIRTGAGVEATQADLEISRISLPTYASMPNKLQPGRPINMLVTRGVAAPTVTLWPVPNLDDTYTLVYWRLRRIQDAGTGVETADVPFRFLPCLTAGLAYYLAMKNPKLVDRLVMLKTVYDEEWQRASDEDREKASVRFIPRVYAR